MHAHTAPRSSPKLSVLANLRQRAIRQRVRWSEFLDDVIDELVQLRAAAALSQQAADRWQARALRAEREVERLRATLPDVTVE